MKWLNLLVVFICGFSTLYLAPIVSWEASYVVYTNGAALSSFILEALLLGLILAIGGITLSGLIHLKSVEQKEKPLTYEDVQVELKKLEPNRTIETTLKHDVAIITSDTLPLQASNSLTIECSKCGKKFKESELGILPITKEGITTIRYLCPVDLSPIGESARLDNLVIRPSPQVVSKIERLMKQQQNPDSKVKKDNNPEGV